MVAKPRFDGEWARLSEACDLVMGQSPSSTSYNQEGKGLPFYQGNADFGDLHPITKTWCNQPRKTAEAGDILISVRAPIGAVNIAGEECCIGRGLAAIRQNGSVVSRDYLFHCLQANRSKLEAMGTGSTFKAIGKRSLSGLAIPIYGPEKQKMIAKQLEGVNECLAAAATALTMFDALVKSRFVEMFGSYNSEFEATLQNVSEFVTVGIANAATHAYVDSGVVMLRNLNVRENLLDDSDLVYIDPEFAAKYKKKRLKAGDILVTRTGYPGTACVVPKKYEGCQTFTTLIVRLKDDSSVTAEYVSHLINSPIGKEFVERSKAGSSQQNFGATSLKLMPIGIPPLALQQEFAAFVAEVDKSRFIVQQFLENLGEYNEMTMEHVTCVKGDSL